MDKALKLLLAFVLFCGIGHTQILPPILQPQPSGGSGTITAAQAAKVCYTATSCAYASNLVSGDMAVAFVMGQDAVPAWSLSTSVGAGCPATWSNVPFHHAGLTGSPTVQTFYAVANSGACTPTVTGTCTDCGVQVRVYHSTTGWQATPLDGSAVNTDAAASSQPVSGTFTASTTDLILANVNDEALGIATCTPGSGYTDYAGATGQDDAGEAGLTKPAGNYTPTFSCTASANWIMQVIGLKIN